MPTTEFYVHKIQKNDSLNSVAKRLQIHPVDLKYFHNERCKISERIIFDHLEGLEKIFVPIDYKNSLLRQKEKSNERPTQFFEPNFYQKEYQVTEILIDKQEQKQLVSYTILVDFEKTKEEQTFLKMDRKDFRLNGKVPDTKLFELANRTQQTISPLQFLLNENGYPVKILAPENLIQNFKEKRTDIEEYFIGDLTKNTSIHLNVIYPT